MKDSAPRPTGSHLLSCPPLSATGQTLRPTERRVKPSPKESQTASSDSQSDNQTTTVACHVSHVRVCTTVRLALVTSALVSERRCRAVGGEFLLVGSGRNLPSRRPAAMPRRQRGSRVSELISLDPGLLKSARVFGCTTLLYISTR